MPSTDARVHWDRSSRSPDAPTHAATASLEVSLTAEAVAEFERETSGAELEYIAAHEKLDGTSTEYVRNGDILLTQLVRHKTAAFLDALMNSGVDPVRIRAAVNAFVQGTASETFDLKHPHAHTLQRHSSKGLFMSGVNFLQQRWSELHERLREYSDWHFAQQRQRPHRTTPLGAALDDLRRQRGWTWLQLAERAGIDPKYIRGYRTGRLKPQPKTVGKLARAFGMPFPELYSLAREPFAAKTPLLSLGDETRNARD